ncbi:MAG: cytochrome C [Gammaproteobacteria bacterium HGW-Gammaproteobacteria-4]|nr:MAG: cytochrome C [Gammaproteobacteria bacterium HGW-Gammaproteobacteria-4]
MLWESNHCIVARTQVSATGRKRCAAMRSDSVSNCNVAPGQPQSPDITPLFVPQRMQGPCGPMCGQPLLVRASCAYSKQSQQRRATMKRSTPFLALGFWVAALGFAAGVQAGDAQSLPELGSDSAKNTVQDSLARDSVCTECHDEYDGQSLSVYQTRHGVKVDERTPTCQACHGDSTAHVDNPNKASPRPLPEVVFGIASKHKAVSNQSTQDDACLSCHDNFRATQHWAGSGHESANVSCTGCHSLHDTNKSLLTAATEVETCLNCHRKQRSILRKRSTHPLQDTIHADGVGTMTCTSCHGPHGTVGEKLIDASTINGKCYECHQEKKAPVLWEHSVVKENCIACHNPHGSNHEMMLVAKQPRLCQQCHEQGRHQTIAGEPNSFLVVNRGCSNCHASIHGTNNPSGIKLKN